MVLFLIDSIKLSEINLKNMKLKKIYHVYTYTSIISSICDFLIFDFITFN